MQNYKLHQELLMKGSIIANKDLIKKRSLQYSIIFGHMLSLQIYFVESKKVDSQGYYYQSFKQLQKQFLIGEKTLRKYLKELEGDGLIKIKRERGKPACYYKITDGILNFLEKNSSLSEVNAISTEKYTDTTEIITQGRGSFYSDPTEIFPGHYPQYLPSNNNYIKNNIIKENINKNIINESLSAQIAPLYKIIDDNREKLISNNVNIDQLKEFLLKDNVNISLFQFEALIHHLINYGEPIQKTVIFVKRALLDIENITNSHLQNLNVGNRQAPIQNTYSKSHFYNWLDERE